MPFPISLKRSKKNVIQKRVSGDDLVRLQDKYGIYYQSFDRQEGTRVWQGEVERVMLSSNDYLGLGSHPRVLEAARQALAEWGSSTTGARLANGSRRYHAELEAELADFLGVEACMVSAAGYLSCMSAVASFATRDDRIYADKNVHSSLVAGMKLSDARVERFRHNDPRDLREALEADDPARGGRMLLFEGVYSMEGQIAPVNEFLDLAREHDCFVVMDDAHGFGVLGEGGRGTLSHVGAEGVDVLCGSFSKALSSVGGFVAGSREVIDYLKVHSKQMIFSAALSPTQAACAREALRVLREEPEHLQRLWANVRRYRELLHSFGLDTWGSQTPALPIVLGSKERAYFFWKKLMDNGVFAVMSIAPAVPPGKDLIRTAISARHTDADFEIIEAALRAATKGL